MDAPGVGLDLPDDIESPAWRKQVRRGQFRRHEPAGAALGVRVLDVTRAAAAASPGDDSHAPPATHMRRGHWRRQRVGPREDWRYEQRWIAPVLVNPGNDRGTVTVYRLPEPPETATQTPADPGYRPAPEPASPPAPDDRDEPRT